MKILNKDISSVPGITALGKHVGIKKAKKDFAVLYSDVPCTAAAVYTKNEVKGAPLYVTKNHLKNGKAQAVVIASGISNVCTGKKGLQDSKKMCSLVAKELSLKTEDVLVACTGVIGEYLPMHKIKKGVKGIKKLLGKKNHAAEAILTTDLVTKQVTVKVGGVTIAGIAKGSGMVHPNMATMLGFIFTDAQIPSKTLQSMLKKSVSDSFNMVSVDGDTSTSDMVMLMANGKGGNVNAIQFQKGLDIICTELAKMIARDGEGATKLIEAKVKGAKKETNAKKIAKAVISSDLVKAAMFGNDPNWGRIMGAIGNAGVSINEKKIGFSINNIPIVKNGISVPFNRKKASNALKKKDVKILINLNNGKKQATAWGCDLSYDYVKINADYHT